MSPSEYFKLDIETEKALHDMIPVLQARELLDQMRVAMWPNMKQQKVQEDHRKLHDAAHPRDLYPKESISLADFMKKGGTIG